MTFGRIFAAFLIAALLTGCNLPTRAQPSPEPDRVATEVSQLLTAIPTTALPAATNTPDATATTAATTPATATLPAPTATEAATPAPTIPLTIPSPTVTVPAGDPKSALGAPTWQDTLETGRLFYLYENENTRITHQEGGLLLSGLTANGWHGWSLTFSEPAQHFYLEAVLNPQTCSGSDLYGLVFRAEDTESGYFFGVTCDGKYGLRARDFADGTNKGLIELTPNNAIQTGSNVVNRLGVMVVRDRIGLYANGVLLQEITDPTFTKEGYFGAFVAANQTAGFTVRLDEIFLWMLPEGV